MIKRVKMGIEKKSNGANLGFEEKLWQAADKMRNNMDAAEYKHVVLGLIFLKYISDAFNELYKKLSAEKGADPEDSDEYRAENVFYVPKKARWDYLQKNAKQPIIGKLVDDAMDEIEKDNHSLKGVLPKNYARPGLDKARFGELIDLIGTIGLGDAENRSKDILGRVYEYFLGQFADAEGKKGGQFYTPRSIVKLLVDMLEPYKGRVFDPCCGSGGMFVQSEKFVEAHEGRAGNISIFGQESNQTTWRLCKMNLAIRRIDGNIHWNNEGSFLKDAHKDLKADFVIANPPFNDSDWKGELLREDVRWKYGTPPPGNANFAWIQHFIYHLAPNGITGFVMHGGAATNGGIEAEIRKRIIEGDLIDCIVATPTQLFYNVGLPAHLWFISKNKKETKYFRDRSNHVLMINASHYGYMEDSTHRVFSDNDINEIAKIYKCWKNKNEEYEDINGICKDVTITDIKNKDYLLAPNRYIEVRSRKKDSLDFSKYSSSGNMLSRSSSAIVKTLGSLDIQKDSKVLVDDLASLLSKEKKENDWEKVKVFELIEEILGGEWGESSHKEEYVECRIIRGKDFPSIYVFNLDKVPIRFVEKQKVDEKKLKDGDLVIEMSGGSKDQPTGRCLFITSEILDNFNCPLLFANFTNVIRVNRKKISPLWFYWYWRNAYKNGVTTKYENQPSGIKNFQLDEFIKYEDIHYPTDTSLQKKIVFYFKSA